MVPMCSDYILKKRLEAYGFKWYHRSDTWHEEPYILQSCGSAFIFWESGSSLNNCVRNYHFKEFSGVEKDITNCSKEKKTHEATKILHKKLPYQFPCIFSFFSSNVPPLDTGPHIECGSGSSRENECGFMGIWIHRPDIFYRYCFSLHP